VKSSPNQPWFDSSVAYNSSDKQLLSQMFRSLNWQKQQAL
jgi:hypothetical protein